MMSFAIVLACTGMVAGGVAALLGVAQLTCEHAESSFMPRFSTLVLAVIAACTAIDCWDVWSGKAGHVDGKAVAFAVILALSWGHRRAFGLQTRPRTK